MNMPPARVIRVALGSLPGLMADVVRSAIVVHPDMTIVTEMAYADSTSAPDALDIDVLITANAGILTTQQPPPADRCVDVVAISADGRHMETYQHRLVHDFSVEQLIGVIRELAKHRCGRDRPGSTA